MKKLLQKEEFEKKADALIKELSKLIEQTEYPMCATEYAVFQLVTLTSESHYETLGLLEEVKNNWREASLKVLNEEEEEEKGTAE